MGISKWAIFDAEYIDPESQETVKVFDPHSGQLEIMEDPSRFKVIAAGRRGGKSRREGNEFIPYAFAARREAPMLRAQGRRREYWIVGPEYADSEKAFRVFFDQCKKLQMPFDKPGTYYSLQSGDMTVSLWDGMFILSAKSEARPTSLIGEALSGMVLDECAKMKQSTWDQLLRPALSDFDGWCSFDSTPEGKNWFYRLYMDATKENNLAWQGFRSPSWRNPHVFKTPTVDEDVKTLLHIMSEHPELTSFEIAKGEWVSNGYAGNWSGGNGYGGNGNGYGGNGNGKPRKLVINEEILQLANDLTIGMFQQEIAADFTDFVGKVFKDFDESTHVRRLDYNPGWETIAAVDYGYRNPNVWLLIQIGPWGEINVIDELYQADLAPDEFAREILRRDLCPDTCHEFYPDPASPGDTRTLENIFRRSGKRVKARSGTGGELNERLNLIRLALRNRMPDNERSSENWVIGDPSGSGLDGGQPRPRDIIRPQMMFSDKCANCIYELGEYRYPEFKNEQVETSTRRFELPMKKDDHTPEAIGRFLAGKYHSMAGQYGGGTKVTKANFLRGLRGRGQVGPTPAGISGARTPVRRGTWMT